MTDKRERNKNICEAWISGQTKPSLATEYGLSVEAIKKIIKGAGLRPIDRKEPVREDNTYHRRPLSPSHRKLGVRVSHQRELELHMSVTEFADKAKLSVHRIVQIERGVYDPTMTEIQRISDASGLPISELMN